MGGILGPGAHFGSTNLWVPKPELASVVARTNSEVLILERKAFARLCAKHKGLTQRVLYDAHSEEVASPTKEASSTPRKRMIPLSGVDNRGHGKIRDQTSTEVKCKKLPGIP